MRIIAGEHRGRLIVGPSGRLTRPITDRAKQSLFDILAPRLPDARVYDCFAGTGSLGLECLSRGASHVHFFERDRGAMAGLRKNIHALGLGDRSTVITADLFGQLQSADPGSRVDLVFLDPPYRYLTERGGELRSLAGALARDHLAPGGLLVFRHDARDSLELPGLSKVDQRRYSSMTIEFLQL